MAGLLQADNLAGGATITPPVFGSASHFTPPHTMFLFFKMSHFWRVYLYVSNCFDELNRVGPIVNKCNALWGRPHLTVLYWVRMRIEISHFASCLVPRLNPGLSPTHQSNTQPVVPIGLSSIGTTGCMLDWRVGGPGSIPAFRALLHIQEVKLNSTI